MSAPCSTTRRDPGRLLAAALALPLIGCGSGAVPLEEPPPAPPISKAAAPAEGGEAAGSTSAAMERSDEGASGEPAGSAAAKEGAVPTPDADGHVKAAGLHLPVPEGVILMPPSSSMRALQAYVPGEDGPATLAVFHFGPGGGGGTEANIQRWISQMEVPDGAEPRRGTLEGNGTEVTFVEVEGTLKAGMMGPRTDQPGYGLFGAVLEGPGGPWFLKVTGPASTVTAARPQLVEMVQDAHPLGGSPEG